jgi:DNA recombination protein RmuC
VSSDWVSNLWFLLPLSLGIALVGTAFAYLWFRSLKARLEERLQSKEDRISSLEFDHREANTQLESSRAKVLTLSNENAELKTKLEESAKLTDEKLGLLDDARKQFSDAFQALSGDVLRENNRSFLEIAENTFAARQRAMDDLVKPLREQIQLLEERRQAAYVSLGEQVRSLGETQLLLTKEAGNLARALRAPNVRGRWGEVQLRRVLELAGMVQYADFVEQEQGIVGRPDLVVRLPGDRKIVVDSKVPLAAYLESLETVDEDRRQNLLRHHAQQVKAHLNSLSSKQYWQQFTPSPEFVIAFLPGEVFFSAALEQDQTLMEQGAEKGVLLATPTTLIALLKAVAFGWRQETATRDAQQIAQLGGQLHERVLSMTNHFEEMRRGLERAVSSYNQAIGSMESRVLVSARKLKDLGVAGAQTDLPFLDQVENQPRVLPERPLL